MAAPFPPTGYTLGKLIGSGGFSKVWTGINNALQREVAIKFIHKSDLTSEEAKVRVRTEIDIHKELRHQYIAPIFEVIENGIMYYIIMEYVPSGTLMDKLIAETMITEASARHYFAQILMALEYIHGKGICHCDLKCENILIDTDNNIRIIDFGLSKRADHNGKVFTKGGSIKYVAPELYDKKEHTLASDIWSLGVILYRCLTGRYPFDQISIPLMAKAVKETEPEYPSILSKEVINLLKQLLEKDPKKRITIPALKANAWVANAIAEEPPASVQYAGLSPDNRALMNEIKISRENSESSLGSKIPLRRGNNRTDSALTRLTSSGRFRPISKERSRKSIAPSSSGFGLEIKSVFESNPNLLM